MADLTPGAPQQANPPASSDSNKPGSYKITGGTIPYVQESVQLGRGKDAVVFPVGGTDPVELTEDQVEQIKASGYKVTEHKKED